MLDLIGKREEEGRKGKLSYSLYGDKYRTPRSYE